MKGFAIPMARGMAADHVTSVKMPEDFDAFWEELMMFIEAARATPERFHPSDGGLRRVNLKRFPYHFLYRVLPRGIRVVVVRHNRRHPHYGTGRI